MKRLREEKTYSVDGPRPQVSLGLRKDVYSIMLHKIPTLICMYMFLATTIYSEPVNSQLLLIPTGIYSNIQMSQESGDLYGIEVEIVRVGAGAQAIVRIAEGVFGTPIIVNKLKYDGNNLEFCFAPNIMTSWTLKAKINESSIQGTLRKSDGNNEKLILIKIINELLYNDPDEWLDKENNEIKKLWKQGRFSNIHYTDKNGNIGGLQIRIVTSPFNHTAIMQLTNSGRLGPLIASEIKGENNKIYFEIPANKFLHHGVFQGEANPLGLSGILRIDDKITSRCELPRVGDY